MNSSSEWLIWGFQKHMRQRMYQSIICCIKCSWRKWSFFIGSNLISRVSYTRESEKRRSTRGNHSFADAAIIYLHRYIYENLICRNRNMETFDSYFSIDYDCFLSIKRNRSDASRRNITTLEYIKTYLIDNLIMRSCR